MSGEICYIKVTESDDTSDQEDNNVGETGYTEYAGSCVRETDSLFDLDLFELIDASEEDECKQACNEDDKCVAVEYA